MQKVELSLEFDARKVTEFLDLASQTVRCLVAMIDTMTPVVQEPKGPFNPIRLDDTVRDAIR